MALKVASFGTTDKLERFVNGAAARGRIICIEPRHITEGQYISIHDGLVSKNFEMDRDASVTPGHIAVDISALLPNDAAGVATALAAAINGAAAFVVTPAAAILDVNLVNDNVGIAGNVKITQSAAAAQFTLEGMSGGSAVVAVADIEQIVVKDNEWFLFYNG